MGTDEDDFSWKLCGMVRLHGETNIEAPTREEQNYISS
jgi:hypothetical protein